MQYNDPEFNGIINNGFPEMNTQQNASPNSQFIDTTPYGAQAQPVKPGLTKRGRVALAIGAVVIAGGGLMVWQHNSAISEASAAKTQELQVEKARIDLEMMKEMNRANAANSKAQNTADSERQKQVTACVNTDKGLVGKQMGVTYSSVLKDCQAQYPATTGTGDMANAAASQDTNGGGGGVNSGLLIGGAVLAGGVVLVVRMGRRNAHAQ